MTSSPTNESTKTMAAQTTVTPTQTPRRPQRWVGFAGLAIVLAMCVVAVGLVRRNVSMAGTELGKPDITGPHVAVVSLGSIKPPPLVARFRGEVRAKRESDLAFRRSGRIVRLAVDNGDAVVAGQLLAELDVSDLDAQATIADAQVAAAAAELAEAVAGPRRQTLEAAAADVRSMRAQLESAQSRLARERSLSTRGAGIEQTVDDLQFEVERLSNGLDRSMSVLEELNEGTRAEQIVASKARLELAKATRAKIDVDRDDSRIVAPYDAIVSRRWIDEGTIVGPNQPVASIVEVTPLEAHFGLPVDVASRLNLGDEVMLQIGQSTSKPIDGNTIELKPAIAPERLILARVVRMQPRVDAMTRTRGVDLEFTLPTDDASPSDTTATAMIGQTALLFLPGKETASESGAFWVPSASLVRGVRGLWSLYGVSDSGASDGLTTRIERCDVQIVRTAGEMTLVAGKVDASTLVVIEGTHRVGPGMDVVVERRDDMPLETAASNWKDSQ